MDEQLLQELARFEFEDGLDLEQVDGGLAVTYGDVPLCIDMEPELLAMRVGVRVHSHLPARVRASCCGRWP